MAVEEPRGSDVLVGALLVSPTREDCVSGVIFFNNVGTLGMCGHGTIGVARTLEHLGKIKPGLHRLETPVGIVNFTLQPDGSVEVENVAPRRSACDVSIALASGETFRGDVAWGGNWFFITNAPVGCEIDRAHVAQLTAKAWEIRHALALSGIVGDDGAEIDHIEFTAGARRSDCAWRNFVLCPGGAYDRSPCGTGTSAKLACLAASGKLSPGQRVGAESVIGTRFEARYEIGSNGIRPFISGRAWITAELELLAEATDPCQEGI